MPRPLPDPAGGYGLYHAHLRRAWTLLKDAEVAAHLGEVLWRLGQRGEARAINAEHPALLQALREVGV